MKGLFVGKEMDPDVEDDVLEMAGFSSAETSPFLESGGKRGKPLTLPWSEDWLKELPATPWKTKVKSLLLLISQLVWTTL